MTEDKFRRLSVYEQTKLIREAEKAGLLGPDPRGLSMLDLADNQRTRYYQYLRRKEAQAHASTKRASTFMSNRGIAPPMVPGPVANYTRGYVQPPKDTPKSWMEWMLGYGGSRTLYIDDSDDADDDSDDTEAYVLAKPVVRRRGRSVKSQLYVDVPRARSKSKPKKARKTRRSTSKSKPKSKKRPTLYIR